MCSYNVDSGLGAGSRGERVGDREIMAESSRQRVPGREITV